MPKISIDPKSKLTGIFLADGVKLRRGETAEVEDGDPALGMAGILIEADPKPEPEPEPKPEPKPAKKKAAKKKKGG